MSMTMYAPQNNGPHTVLASDINSVQTDIEVLDASVLPEAPNVLTLGTDEDAELVILQAVTGNILTVSRGFNGTAAKNWASGDWVYRAITAQDISALQAVARNLIEQLEALAPVATSGSYNDLTDKPSIPAPVTVDAEVIDGSENPVSSDAVHTALAEKADASHDQAASTITAGTFAGKVVANASGSNVTTACIRNIVYSSSTPSVVNGQVWLKPV